MRAVLMSRGRMWADSVPEPTPERGEILVRTRACGICGSDLHACRHTDRFVATSREVGGAFKLTTFEPVVFGHEFCAEVVDYGPDTARRLAPGQLVTAIPVLPRDGAALTIGYSDEIPGGFAEYMLLNDALTLPVPNGLPARVAALTEPMAVGMHAVAKSRLTEGDGAVVLGAGPVGLAVISALRQRGTAPIIASDYSPARREMAARMGAHDVLDPKDAAAFRHRELPPGERLVAFECVGVPGMIDQVFAEAPANTRIVVVGVCLETDHARPLLAINKELNVQYVLGYTPDEFSATLNALADGSLDVGEIITDEIGLEAVPAMFDTLATPTRQAKVIVDPTL